MLQLSYSVAQEWCESCNFLSKRFQSSLLDCVGCAFLIDEIGYLRLHIQVECGITPGPLGDEVEEVPLWHESEETAVSREMGEIRDRDDILSHLTGELSYFLMRAFQELVQNTEFMHNLKCGWMDRIPAKIT